MLSRCRTVRAAVALVLTAVLGLVGGLSLVAGPAVADPVCDGEIVFNPITGEYSCTNPGGATPGDPGGGGGGGPSEPTCELRGEATYCIGTRACWDEPALPPVALPEGERPNEDSVAMAIWCYEGNVRALEGTYWSDDGEPPTPSLQEQAQTALGQIVLDPGTLTTSPDGRTLVNLDTWYWLEGAAAQAQGSSAFGLVATAVATTLSVDPGDGAGAFECPLVTTSAAAERSCTYVYRRASNRGSAQWEGRPAYAASASVVYELSFAINGTPVTIPGVPATLTSPPATTPVRVDEVQAVVERSG